MALAQANLIQFPHRHTEDIAELFNKFISRKARNSKSTATKFEGDIRRFFMFTRGKEVEELTMDDLRIMNAEVIDYQEHLQQSGEYKNSTINNAITGVISLYRFFKANYLDVNPEALIVDKLPDDTRHIGNMSPEEVHILADLALGEQRMGQMKRGMIYTAYATGIRLGALLKLQLKHFRQDRLDPDKYIIETDYDDKGKIIDKEIHRSVFEIIYGAMSDKDEEAYVFPIGETTAKETIKRLIEKAGFDPKRRLSFHSLRKAGADFAHEYSNGDMFVVTSQGNWSNPQTVHQNYLKRQRNVAGMAAFEEFDEDLFDKLTHEEAVALLKSISPSSGVGAKLRKDAENILKSR